MEQVLIYHGLGFSVLAEGNIFHSASLLRISNSDASLGVHGNELTPCSSLRECTVGFSPCLARVTTRQLSAAF